MTRIAIAVTLVFATCHLVTATVNSLPVHVGDEYVPTIQNLDTGRYAPYNKAVWSSQQACDAAIKGLDARLRALSDTRITDLADGTATPLPEAPDADPALLASLNRLIVYVIENTGKIPNFAITCELVGSRNG